MLHPVTSFERWLPTLISIPIVGLVLYRRLSRAFRRQPIAAPRMLLRIGILSLVASLFLVAMPTPKGLAAAAIGALVGAGLALFGLARTQLEATPEGRFYTPHKWTELIVMALFFGRLAARMLATAQLASTASRDVAADPALQRSPLTLALFFVLAAYYVVYYLSLLRRARSLVIAGTTPPR